MHDQNARIKELIAATPHGPSEHIMQCKAPQAAIIYTVALLACNTYAIPSWTSASIRPATTSASGPVPYASSFVTSCWSWDGDYGNDYAVMQATCSDGHGGINTTTINLNDCIGNAGPNLFCAER